MSHQFSQAPTADIPRSSFNRSSGYKTTFDAGKLIPVFVDEVLPGDTFNMNPTLFARLNTPIYPIMDNMFLDLHFFFVPYRQIWDNFRKFCGEQTDPGDSTDYTVPILTTTNTAGIQEGDLGDYMGLPIGKGTIEVSALPGRAYNHIYNEWYRDQNLIDSKDIARDDGPDTAAECPYNLPPYSRGKRHDYFTSCLPWLQKGDSVDLPLGTTAPVEGRIDIKGSVSGATGYMTWQTGNDINSATSTGTFSNGESLRADSSGTEHLYADLSTATAATINQLRQAFQIQKLLERDARSGTRYSEIVRAHFGVNFLDVTYRPEFLGGSSTPINISTVPQTSSTDATSPQGNLAAFGTAVSKGGGFTKSFTEHGVVMGIASVRADLTYQQGLNRMWSRSTRYDFYWPALAHIGEQAVLNKEIYCQDSTVDTGSTGTPDNEKVFGYQERWAEYRYRPSMITGSLRSSATTPLDAWHLSQEFTALPELNETFITENPPMDRVVAVTTEPDFIMDCYFNLQCARPIPLYSVPGLIDHF
jgi:hypothetical protein